MRALISILLFSFAFSQEYCAGQQISNAHQNQIFNVCYPCDTCDPWSLSQYAGDILFLDMSASWCAPCFSAIDFIDQLEEYWSEQNINVKFVTALSDIDEPYSCNDWGNAGTTGSPLIVEDDGRLFDWFHDSNGQYPSYVLIDHEMRVRAKPSSVLSNGNSNECDGSVEDISSFDGGCLNEMITQLLDECGEDCSISDGCSDDNACNDGDAADCIYPQENYNCCGECTAEIDCLGICGGNTPEDDPACFESTGDCPTCIIVPSEHFATVQSGIEAAVDGDTVLVEPGTYYENLVIQKSITLASRAIFDDLSSWVGYTDEYVVLNDNINATVLDGSLDTNGDGLESVILIDSPSDECIDPLIFGFTITGGNGTVVMVDTEGRDGEREEVEQIRGGGFLSRNALPNFKYNAIVNNKGTGDDKVHSGGGGEESNGDQIRMRETRGDYTWGDGRTECSGEIDLSFNFYKDNDATYGNTFSTLDFEGSIDMSNSIFDVYDCPEDEVTTVWVDVEDEVEVDFSYGVGDLCSITDDVWVSPGGADNNLGTSESQAFLTIGRAFEMIAPEDGDPVTIYLTEGIFSPGSTGEEFPIVMISNVNLIGQGEEVTIIDAEDTHGVFLVANCENTILSGFTVMGAATNWEYNIFSEYGGGGGGITIVYSNYIIVSNLIVRDNDGDVGAGIFVHSTEELLLENLLIKDNTGMSSCSGIDLYGNYNGMPLNQVPILNNLIIDHNVSMEVGGGLCVHVDAILNDITISNNQADDAVGMYLGGAPILSDIRVVNNSQIEYYGEPNYWSSAVLVQGNAIMNNVLISGNSVVGLTYYPAEINLNNVTIADNLGAGLLFVSEIVSGSSMINSIVWNNSEAITVAEGISLDSLSIRFSDIQGGWIGEGNINENPEFISDYELANDSPCINSGDDSVWSFDIDGSRTDMGFTGGSFIRPSFTEYDFGQVGNVPLGISWSLFNYRPTPITIDSVTFQNSEFSVNNIFPLHINPIEENNIEILGNFVNIIGQIQDSMTIYSDDLPDNLYIVLSATGTGENIISGDIYGHLSTAEYMVTNDIVVPHDKELILSPGTKLLFMGPYTFTIRGTLKAEGTLNDSIIFTNYDALVADTNKWRGITLYQANDQTVFDYVVIQGAYNEYTLYESGNGGGMYIYNTNPTISNATIRDNSAHDGSGFYIVDSAPALSNIDFINNSTKFHWTGILFIEYMQAVLSSQIPLNIQNINFINNACFTDSSGTDSYGRGPVFKLYYPSHTECSWTNSCNEWELPDFHSISNINITNNNCAGILLNNVPSVDLSNLLIRDNSSYGLYLAGDYGVGDYNNASINIHDNVITSNDTTGLIISNNHPNIILSNTEISQNGYTGLHLQGVQAVQINNLSIINNLNSGIEITGDDYNSNYAFPRPVLIENTLISGNGEVAAYGGGIYCTRTLIDDPITLNNVIIRNNQSQAWGGGIYLEGSANNQPGNLNLSINRVLIVDNTTRYFGSAIYLNNYNVDIVNATIANNESTYWYNYEGSTISIYNFGSNGNPVLAHFSIINSIVWGNKSGDTPENSLIISLDPSLDINYSNIQGGWPSSDGTIYDFDPLFINSNSGNYELQSTSPCIDAGISDIDGDGVDDILDFSGLAPDLGSFEYGLSGCMDESACNYNPNAIFDSGSCQFEYDCLGICGGNAQFDCNGICNGGTVLDYCGICGGSNFQLIECWDGTCVEDSNDCSSICDNTPGLVECCNDDECINEQFIGDGWCDDGWGGCDLSCFEAEVEDCSSECGNGICENVGIGDADENNANCPSDCPSTEACMDCQNDYSMYGVECCDKAWDWGYTCDELETYFDFDCSGCECIGGECGDGYCNGDETYHWCPEDCCVPEDQECYESSLPDCSSCGCWPDNWINDGWCEDNDATWDLSCYSINLDGSYCQIEGTPPVGSGLPICDEGHAGPDGGDCGDRSDQESSDIGKKKHFMKSIGLLTYDQISNNTREEHCGGYGPDVGCDGICFSEIEFDGCDVCGGDGSSCIILGDLNSDGLVDVLDVVALVENILSDGEYNPAGDLEEDGVLNVLDIVALVNLILGGG